MKRRESSGVACGPNNVVAGSPGTIDDSVNRSSIAPITINTVVTRRLERYRSVSSARAERPATIVLSFPGPPPTASTSRQAAVQSSYCQSIQPGTPAGLIQLRWTSVLVSLVSQTNAALLSMSFCASMTSCRRFD